MSFLRITTVYAGGHEKVDVIEQPVPALRAFENRVKRVKATSHPRLIDYANMTIRLNPTSVIEYTQYLEYAENYEELGV